MSKRLERVRRVNAKRPPEVRIRRKAPTPEQEDEIVRILARLLDQSPQSN